MWILQAFLLVCSPGVMGIYRVAGVSGYRYGKKLKEHTKCGILSTWENYRAKGGFPLIYQIYKGKKK